MDEVALATEADEHWMTIPAVRLGVVPGTLRTPDAFALVTRAETPHLRIELYRSPDEYGVDAFQSAVVWERFVVIGAWEHVYFIDLESDQWDAIAFDLEAYFGSMKVAGKRLLIASAERAFSFDANARLEWKSLPIGLDGVVFEEVRDGLVRGSGEWDPPGGWKPFVLSVTSGEVLRNAV